MAFVFLMLLRVAVGYHFYKEGTNKLKSGTFTSRYFLAGAKGPVAPWFHGMLEDSSGAQLLCIQPSENDPESGSLEVDPELTLLVWDDFLDKATDYFGFGSPDLQQDIEGRRQTLADQIAQARERQDRSVDTAALEARRDELERSILAIRSQPVDLELIYNDHQDQLLDWLNGHRIELISHFGTEDRLDGFERDGENRKQASLYVESLRGQVDTIRTDRAQQLTKWTREVSSLWDSLERKVNGLAVDEQAKRDPLPLHRPFDEKYSFYKVVDRVIPWFDTLIGVSLILGLFTRLSSLAAAGFLISVILAQPPWVPGTEPTYFYFIELLALLVIFATSAGRMGGLDYFFSSATWKRKKRSAADAGPSNQARAEGQLT